MKSVSIKTVRSRCLLFFGMTLTSAILVGCSSFSTIPTTAMEQGSDVAPDSNMLNGIFYFLPEGRVHIVGVKKDDAFTITISSDLVADTSKRYYAKPQRNFLYDDTTELSIDNNGLLSSAKATAKDETVAILSAIAQDVGVMQAHPNNNDPVSFDIVFYPEDRSNGPLSYTKAKDILLKRCHLTLNCACKSVDNLPKAKTPLPNDKFKDANDLNGLVFRIAKPYRVTIDNDIYSDAVPQVRAGQVVLLPDKTRNYVLDFSRMPFVSKVTNVTFTNGMLSTVHQEVPSPILGFLGIPKALLQAILPLPQSPAAVSGTATAK